MAMKGMVFFAVTGVVQGLFVEKAMYSSSSCADKKTSLFGLAQAEWWDVDGDDQLPRNCKGIQRNRKQP